LVTRPAKCGKQRRDKSRVVDRHARGLREVALKEARRHPPTSLRLLGADQSRKLQQLLECRSADLAQRGLGNEKVASVECSSKYGPRMPLGGDSVPLLGPESSDPSGSRTSGYSEPASSRAIR
jgi:hypothetical protein